MYRALLTLLAAGIIFLSMSATVLAETQEEQVIRTKFLQPHKSRVSAQMVTSIHEWYGVPVSATLAIFAAETSLADPRLGGRLVGYNNFGCLRYHGADTPWGKLSSGKCWVGGKSWYKFPDPWTGIAAWGRYMKHGVGGRYLPLLQSGDWSSFAKIYYGKATPGLKSYTNRLVRFASHYKAVGRSYGFEW